LFAGGVDGANAMHQSGVTVVVTFLFDECQNDIKNGLTTGNGEPLKLDLSRESAQYSSPNHQQHITEATVGKLAGKIALITGASRGIGKGIAEGFAREGAALILVARDLDRLRKIEEEMSAARRNVVVIQADVTNEQQVQEAFRQTMAMFGRLDILVNNAGVFDGGPLDELTLEAWEKVMAVNLRGPFLCTREALRIMKPQQSGRIINIGSISAQRVRPNSAAYSTSKHGIWGLTQVTQLEGRPHGISCCCLHPGNVEVETLAGAQRRNNEPVMQPEELAEAAITMAALPAHISMLEAIVMPVTQPYIGRG
jgi:NAD(P)-dependent dehydrogenase (short-subunit alcohol dehydrogenase family)